jgi:hypothetical protein
VGEPVSPPDLQHLLQVCLIHGNNDENGSINAEPEQLIAEGREILRLKGVIEYGVPLIEQDADVDRAQIENDDGGEDRPGPPALLRPPIRTANLPKLTREIFHFQQTLQARIGRRVDTGGKGGQARRSEATAALKLRETLFFLCTMRRRNPPILETAKESLSNNSKARLPAHFHFYTFR